MALSKNYQNSAGSRSHLSILLLKLPLNKKWKNKNRISWHLHTIQKSGLLKTWESHFLNIFCLKNFLAIPHGFIKMFHLQRVRYPRFSVVQQVLSRLLRISSRWFLFIQSGEISLPFNLFNPQKPCNHKKNHACLNLVYSICHRLDLYRVVKLLTSSFCYYF